MLDRLERAGYVRRVRDVDDRRRVFVEATELARRLAWEIYGPMGEMGAPVIARFSDDELRAIKEFLEDGADVQLRRAAQLREQLERDGPLRPAVDREAG
jgi:DNA-binding MarR family transcriptional regulator